MVGEPSATDAQTQTLCKAKKPGTREDTAAGIFLFALKLNSKVGKLANM
jgi:hypothetical protein